MGTCLSSSAPDRCLCKVPLDTAADLSAAASAVMSAIPRSTLEASCKRLEPAMPAEGPGLRALAGPLGNNGGQTGALRAGPGTEDVTPSWGGPSRPAAGVLAGPGHAAVGPGQWRPPWVRGARQRCATQAGTRPAPLSSSPSPSTSPPPPAVLATLLGQNALRLSRRPPWGRPPRRTTGGHCTPRLPVGAARGWRWRRALPRRP